MNLPYDSIPGIEFIKQLSSDIIPTIFREYQKKLNVPSLSVEGCRLLALLAGIKQPKNAIDIGCGIGASTISIKKGAPKTKITAIDANIDRYKACKLLLEEHKDVNVVHSLAESYLQLSKETYDFAFVDTIKKDYSFIWYLLKKQLNPGAVVIFDDVLLHGYTCETKSTVPLRYRDGRKELRDFLIEISNNDGYFSQIFPLGGGMLVLYT